jgi:hypothetical protein
METLKLEKKIEDLSVPLKVEVSQYIDYLVFKSKKNSKKGKFKFDWEGGLSDLKEQYTSVELQHKALEWRNYYILNDKK